MEDKSYIERLMEFGLTRQEAGIYGCLISEGKTTGYEVAKQLGISRSNAYNSLASMTEKGAAYLVEEGTTKKYVSVPLDEFCRNRIRRLEESQRWLKKHMPSEKDHVEGYITIEGSSNILDKIRNLLAKAEERVYISCTRNYLLLFVDELESLIRAKKKVVIVTDQPVNFRNARVYMGNNRGMQIGVMGDKTPGAIRRIKKRRTHPCAAEKPVHHAPAGKKGRRGISLLLEGAFHGSGKGIKDGGKRFPPGLSGRAVTRRMAY